MLKYIITNIQANISSKMIKKRLLLFSVTEDVEGQGTVLMFFLVISCLILLDFMLLKFILVINYYKGKNVNTTI